MTTTTISENVVQAEPATRNAKPEIASTSKTFKISVPANGPRSACSFVFRAKGKPSSLGGSWRVEVWSGTSWSPFASAEDIAGFDDRATDARRVGKNVGLMVEHAENFVAELTR